MALFAETDWSEDRKRAVWAEMQLEHIRRAVGERAWGWRIGWFWAQVAQAALCQGWVRGEERWRPVARRIDLRWLWTQVAQAAICELWVQYLRAEGTGRGQSAADREALERAFVVDALAVA